MLSKAKPFVSRWEEEAIEIECNDGTERREGR